MTQTSLRPSPLRGVPAPAPWPVNAAVPHRRRGATATAGTRWSQHYVALLLWTDVVVVVAACLAALGIRFGTRGLNDAATTLARADDAGPASAWSYGGLTVLLALAWLGSLLVFRTRSRRVVAAGTEEYRRVVHATLALFGAIAIAAYLSKVEVARGFLLVALPLGLAGLLLGRAGWRVWLARQRKQGRAASRVVVVGGHAAATAVAATFERSASSGFRVVGVCVPGHAAAPGETLEVGGHVIPVLGDQDDVLEAIDFAGANMVAVTDPEALGLRGMRDLGWALESVDVDLVVSPGVIDVAGPRLHLRPVAGLPLLHVEEPQYHGASRMQKVLLDVTASGLALVVAAPVMLALAALVALTSRGPVLYRSERVGRHGQTFSMLKFRSMVVDAEARRGELVGDNEAAGPLFKMRADPRVTTVGRVMRKLSLDELPQLVNVLRGEMSLVGPRPPLQSEVDTYSHEVHRRLLVRPGITGLWQVSGRSDLPWEEAVRLDLSYVENWSAVQDLSIIARTLRAVVFSRGAY